MLGLKKRKHIKVRGKKQITPFQRLAWLKHFSGANVYNLTLLGIFRSNATPHYRKTERFILMLQKVLVMHS